ncbi:MAG: class I SAM-dependent methyltransferase [Candidatus Omnitrophica bacterium]|nr:class I SAM-dependent methyltransferase [Candidatus Omnitrophota bacterium]
MLSGKTRLNLCQRIIDHVFRPMHLGRMTLILPNGGMLTYGNGQGGVHASIRINRNDFFKKCVLFGDVGFGEAYVDGDWETDDITKVIEWMIINVDNHPTLMSDKKKRTPVNFLKICNNILSFFRKNSLLGSQKNISAHYDLGNEFYQLFLDSSMTYSSAYFKHPNQSLEDAQYQKYEGLCQKLKLKPTDHVLEIGSGWGGFAIYAAKNYGCHVTTVTVSQQQFNFALYRIAAEQLADKITLELKDYRKVEGKFDKIVSIEMLEAVGHEYYESYFSQCHHLLKKDGILALQMILSPDNRYESFRKNIDWIQKHIFPGSLLPSVAIIQKMINKTGDLNLYHFEDITADYVKTLAIWRENFNKKLEQVRGQGFDETFIRKWNYYLSYCEAAFKTRNISVAQVVFTRPNNLSLM